MSEEELKEIRELISTQKRIANAIEEQNVLLSEMMEDGLKTREMK